MKFAPSQHQEHFDAIFNSKDGLAIREDKDLLQHLHNLPNLDTIDFNHHDGVYDSALYLATASERLETIQFLLEKGASPAFVVSNGKTPIHLAAHMGSFAALKLLPMTDGTVKDNFGETPLIRAIGNAPRKSLNDVLNLLLIKDDRAVHIANKEGTLPIQLAFQRGSKDAVALLITHGAKVDDPLLRRANSYLFMNAREMKPQAWFMDKSNFKKDEQTQCAELIMKAYEQQHGKEAMKTRTFIGSMKP